MQKTVALYRKKDHHSTEKKRNGGNRFNLFLQVAGIRKCSVFLLCGKILCIQDIRSCCRIEIKKRPGIVIQKPMENNLKLRNESIYNYRSVDLKTLLSRFSLGLLSLLFIVYCLYCLLSVLCINY